MSYIQHSTGTPVELGAEFVARVAKSHLEIVTECKNDPDREATGNARCAVTKPASIPPWAK